jgi:hypothetical protein
VRTARYRIICQRNTARYGREAGSWSGFGKLETICRSLARDGFAYDATVTAISDDRLEIIVTGTAGRAKRSRKPCRARITVPPALLPEKCRKLAEENRARCIRPGVIPRRRTVPEWDRYSAVEKRAERRRIGRAVARAIARGESHLAPEVVYGENYGIAFAPVPVASAVAFRKRPARVDIPEWGHDTEARKLFLAEYLYWREMEALSGQRDRWKPGLTDDTFYADEEVQTHAA